MDTQVRMKIPIVKLKDIDNKQQCEEDGSMRLTLRSMCAKQMLGELEIVNFSFNYQNHIKFFVIV